MKTIILTAIGTIALFLSGCSSLSPSGEAEAKMSAMSQYHFYPFQKNNELTFIVGNSLNFVKISEPKHVSRIFTNNKSNPIRDYEDLVYREIYLEKRSHVNPTESLLICEQFIIYSNEANRYTVEAVAHINCSNLKDEYSYAFLDDYANNGAIYERLLNDIKSYEK